MDFAIYLHMLHMLGKAQLPIVVVWRVGRGRHEIVFDDPDDVISGMEADFVNSPEAANFAAAQKSLKSILRDKARDQRRAGFQPDPEDDIGYLSRDE